MALLGDLGREILENEGHVRRNPSNRIPGMHADELVKWPQEGSLMFERTRHEHDTTQPFFRRGHVYSYRARHLLRQPRKPLGASRGYANASRPQQEFKSNPEQRIASTAFIPSQ